MNLSKITTLFSFTLLLLISSNSLFSQTEVKTNIENENNFEAQEIIDATLKIKKNNYIISHKDEKYSCKKYTEEMKFVSKKKFSFQNKELLNIHEIGGNIVFIYTQDKLKKNKKGNIFAHVFDVENMELKIGNIVLDEFICKNEFIGAKLHSTKSENNFLTLSKIGYRTRKEIFPSKIKIFNKDLKEVWKKELKHSDKNILISILSLKIEDNGIVNTILSYINNDKDEIIETKLEKISIKNNKTINKINIKKIEAATMQFGKNNEIFVAGKYRNGVGNQFGTYAAIVDNESFEIKSSSEIIHSAELLSRGKSKTIQNTFKRFYNEDKTAKKASIVFLASYGGVGSIELKENGGFYIINKNIRQYLHTSSTERFGATTGEVFDTKGVIVTSVDNSGKILWDQFIPKNQTLATSPGFDVQLNKGYSDCFYTSHNNSIYFIYNDLSKNISLDKEISRFWGKRKNSSLFLVEIDENGKIKKTIIKDNSNLKGMALVRQGINLKNNQTLFFLSDDEKSKKRKLTRTLTLEF